MAGLGFADAEDDRHQYTIVIHNVMARLWEAEALADGEFATGPQRSGDLANDQSEQLDHAIQNKGSVQRIAGNQPESWILGATGAAE